MLGGSVANMVRYCYGGGDYIFTPYNYVTCRNGMGGRVVCHVSAWGDV